MKEKYKEILLALILGLVVPGLLFWAVDKFKIKPENSIQNTTAVASLQPEKSKISVKTDQGIEMMDLEEYLVGVVLREMPANFEVEALKSQAVVARTYTLKRIETGGKHDEAIICTNSSCCQGYCSPAE